MTMNSAMSLAEVGENPTAAQASATPEQGLWTLISADIEGSQDIKIVASRNLASGIDMTRDFRLGQSKDWAIGFFDMSGVGAFSD